MFFFFLVDDSVLGSVFFCVVYVEIYKEDILDREEHYL